MRQLILSQPNPLGHRNTSLLCARWLLCFVHSYFFAAMNSTANNAPAELSTDARP